MTWKLDPEIREKVERFDAKPWYSPGVESDRPWLVELGLSKKYSEIARHSDGSLRRFETDSDAWAWIETNAEAD